MTLQAGVSHCRRQLGTVTPVVHFRTRSPQQSSQSRSANRIHSLCETVTYSPLGCPDLKTVQQDHIAFSLCISEDPPTRLY